MSNVIYKYPANLNNTPMPKGAQILHVGLQGEQVFIWALVNPSAEMVTRNVRCAMTGFSILDDNIKYIGTVQHSDDYVEHYFDGGES